MIKRIQKSLFQPALPAIIFFLPCYPIQVVVDATILVIAVLDSAESTWLHAVDKDFQGHGWQERERDTDYNWQCSNNLSVIVVGISAGISGTPPTKMAWETGTIYHLLGIICAVLKSWLVFPFLQSFSPSSLVFPLPQGFPFPFADQFGFIRLSWSNY